MFNHAKKHAGSAGRCVCAVVLGLFWAAAAQAQKATEAASVEADRARRAVDDAVREINRVSDHIDQINRDRAARNADRD